MNKIIKFTAVAGAFALAQSAGAATTTMNGSDTMLDLTRQVITAAPAGDASHNITYNGGGSSTGEQNMLVGKQQSSPMSRALQASRTCRAATPAQSYCKAVALDGIAILQNQANNPAGCAPDPDDATKTLCQGVTTCTMGTGTFNVYANGNTTTPVLSTYTLNSAFDALRLVFAGMDHNAGSATANKRCNGDVRRSLLNQWAQVFSGCTVGTCGTATGSSATVHQITHAFRRCDFSGTTDTFTNLLGLLTIPAIGNVTQTAIVTVPVPENPFCNGWEREDNDPVRSTCGTNGDQVCEVSAGIVLPVCEPENLTAGPGGTAYPTTACDPSSGAAPDQKPARRTLDSLGNTYFECPEQSTFKSNGGVIFGTCTAGTCTTNAQCGSGGTCTAGACTAGNCSLDSNCGTSSGICSNPTKWWGGSTYNIAGACYVPWYVNGTTHNYDCVNTRANHTPPGTDGLAENRFLRTATGALRSDSVVVPVANAFYRLRANCTENSATKQVGCLTDSVACSIGYSGAEATDDDHPGAPVAVNNILPARANIEALVLPPSATPVYPIARTLNFCSMIGLNNLTDTNESALRDAMTGVTALTATTVGTIADNLGFFHLPAGANTCIDFNEAAATGGCNTLSTGGSTNISCNTNADCGVWPCTNNVCDFSCTPGGAGDSYCQGKWGSTASCLSTSHCGFATNTPACI